MDNKFEDSIKRAIALLKTPADYQNYLLLKFTLEPFSCHALNHWPDTWKQINEYIYPGQPIKNEGDALVERDGNKFVLESHESGPEIILYLGLATASISLITAIINLVILITKGFLHESRGQSSRIKISKKQIIKGKIEEENLIEIDIPISKKIEKQLKEKINQAINKNP